MATLILLSSCRGDNANEIRPLKTKQSKTNQTCKEVLASAKTNKLVNIYSLAIN